MVDALSGDVYRYAFFLCRNEAQAQDIAQETFLRAWRFLPALRDDGKARSWLFTTVRREHARLYERYVPVMEELDPERVPAAPGESAETLAVRKAMLGLPEKYREVLTLQVLGGYTGLEIAELLGIPRATVNTRLFRARNHLRRALDLDDSDAAPPALQREHRA
jgi:RNA polymerase sigma-70 factor (ECF subfamily)